jgi:hypothetical protein
MYAVTVRFGALCRTFYGMELDLVEAAAINFLYEQGYISRIYHTMHELLCNPVAGLDIWTASADYVATTEEPLVIPVTITDHVIPNQAYKLVYIPEAMDPLFKRHIHANLYREDDDPFFEAYR